MGATTLVANDSIRLAPRLVTEGVYSATGCAFSHLFSVVTHRSVVVIDTTESMAAALSDSRKISALPISHLIYATITPTTPARPKPSTLTLLSTIGTLSRTAALLSSCGMPPAKRRITRLSGSRKRVLFPADLYYGRFSVLSNPMKRDRHVAAWADSLDRMRDLRPEHFAPRIALRSTAPMRLNSGRSTTDARSARSMTKRPDASIRETVEDAHAAAASQKVPVVTRSYDIARAGANTRETMLTPRRSGNGFLVKHFSLTFNDDPCLEAQPL